MGWLFAVIQIATEFAIAGTAHRVSPWLARGPTLQLRLRGGVHGDRSGFAVVRLKQVHAQLAHPTNYFRMRWLRGRPRGVI
jgi:hypothetical protein